MHTDRARLAAGKYLLVTTFRKDATPVPTPVWVVEDDDELLIWTARDSGKVKRIRRDGAVEVAPCTARGKPTGPAARGRARLLDATRSEQVRKQVIRKYGAVGWLVVWGSWVRGGKDRSIGVAITLD
jgi:PPOX class probable F420-dependent enzyme